MRRIWLVIAAVFVIAGLATPATAGTAAARSPASPASAADKGIIAKLKHLSGVTYLGKNPYPPPGYRVYELEIKQPIDHHRPSGPTFEQHLELYQRDLTAPMVMYVSGYFNYTYLSPKDTYLSAAAAIVDGNQISVEHRFYGDSVPHPTLWKYLTIWQQAADEHHVVQVFKKLYRARWLITGVSKGGETSIFTITTIRTTSPGLSRGARPASPARSAAATTTSSPTSARRPAAPRCCTPRSAR